MATDIRPLGVISDEVWREYWRRTPALRRAWADESPTLKLHDPRGTNKRTFMRAWAAAARAYRRVILTQAEKMKADIDASAAKAVSDWEKVTNLSMLD